MQITCGALVTDVPDGWRDESTIVYTMPPDPQLVARLAAGSSPRSSPAAITVTWEDAGDLQAAAFLEGRLETLRRSLQGFKLLGRGDAGGGDSPVPYLEYGLAARVPLSQILLVRRVGALMVVVTGTAQPATYPGAHHRSLLPAARRYPATSESSSA